MKQKTKEKQNPSNHGKMFLKTQQIVILKFMWVTKFSIFTNPSLLFDVQHFLIKQISTPLQKYFNKLLIFLKPIPFKTIFHQLTYYIFFNVQMIFQLKIYQNCVFFILSIPLKKTTS